MCRCWLIWGENVSWIVWHAKYGMIFYLIAVDFNSLAYMMHLQFFTDKWCIAYLVSIFKTIIWSHIWLEPNKLIIGHIYMYCKVLGLTWDVWDEQIFTLCPNIILGADVLYETSGRFVPIFLFPIWWLFLFCFTYHLTGKMFLPRMHFEAFDYLFPTVAFLLQNSPSSVFIIAYYNRRWLWVFNSWSFLG